MSGRKRPYIPREQIEVIYEELRIKKLRNQIEREKSKNKQMSKDINTAFKKIDTSTKHLKQQQKHLKQQQTSINKLNNQIGVINQRHKSSRKITKEWLNLIQKQYKALTQLEMNRFFSKEYKNYTDQISNITKNLNNEQYQAAIALAQNWHTTLKNDMTQIEQTYLNGKELEVELEDSFKQLEIMMKKQIIKREFDTEEGEKESIEINKSYWAEDEWKKADKMFQKITLQIKNLNTLNLPEMQTLEKEIDKTVEHLNHASSKAQINFTNYVKMADMQEDIAEKMRNRGFEIVDNIYEDNDDRKNNLLLMENERGEKILVNIGRENEDLNMEIDFNSLDPLTHSERLKGIMQTIGAKDYETVQGYEHKPAEKERFNLERYVNKQI